MITIYLFPILQATHLVKEKLVAEDRSKKTEAEKEAKVQGLLNQIIGCNATLHVSFPIHRLIHSCIILL